ncbi:hypothetical protein M3201_00395 [Paenibacillus motobuensis]|nr:MULTISPECIES: hypothetical protein [Paenibacillus]MCM3038162.1 hypothetical protein [Paenibacillus lutimineralis]MCM3645266.1 hypothetical protein [Paenibacillus motobuensis]
MTIVMIDAAMVRHNHFWASSILSSLWWADLADERASTAVSLVVNGPI